MIVGSKSSSILIGLVIDLVFKYEQEVEPFQSQIEITTSSILNP